MSYVPKNIDTGKEGRDKLINGITKLATAVKSTLGPGGKTVIIESPDLLKGMTVTKDGMNVAKSIDLADPIENIAVRLLKEAAEKTGTEAGDSTTTSIVIAEALVKEGSKYDLTGTDLKELQSLSENVVDSLIKKKHPITKKRMYDIAYTSTNGDAKAAELITKAYSKVGKRGVVLYEKSETTQTDVVVTNGTRLKQGYTSPLFANNQTRGECILQDCFVLVTDREITNYTQIQMLLEWVMREGKSLLIIAECSQQMTNLLIANMHKGAKWCVVATPANGERKYNLMDDVATATGAKFFSQRKGSDVTLINPQTDLGFVKSVTVSKTETVLVPDTDNEERNAKVAVRIAELEAALKLQTKKGYKDFIKERIASLSGGVAVVQVGGYTDMEHKELYDRVEDAVYAVKGAMDGVLPGGGVSLRDAAKTLPVTKAGNILKVALEATEKQIYENVGVNYPERYRPDGVGYDLREMKEGNMVEMGVIDPMNATINAIRNAVAVATTVLSTNAIVTMERVPYETDRPLFSN